jgi:hypothetical protein
VAVEDILRQRPSPRLIEGAVVGVVDALDFLAVLVNEEVVVRGVVQFLPAEKFLRQGGVNGVACLNEADLSSARWILDRTLAAAAFFLPLGLADVGFAVDVVSGTDATGSLETGITTCSLSCLCIAWAWVTLTQGYVSVYYRLRTGVV